MISRDDLMCVLVEYFDARKPDIEFNVDVLGSGSVVQSHLTPFKTTKAVTNPPTRSPRILPITK